MELVYDGKTKAVYKLSDNNYKLFFKDDVTGENGKFDPGANTVGLSIKGVGKENLAMSSYFFRLIESKGYKTHYISHDIDNCFMTVKQVTMLGKGLEVICRFKATGSFIRRYGDYIQDGDLLDSFVEITLKDDLHGDPTISHEALIMLNILKEDEYQKLIELTKNICIIIKNELASKNIELYDIKLEFGKDTEGNILLIDEISSGNMRTFFEGKFLKPFELKSKLNIK